MVSLNKSETKFEDGYFNKGSVIYASIQSRCQVVRLSWQNVVENLYFTFMWYADLISEACNDKQVSYNVAMVIVSYT